MKEYIDRFINIERKEISRISILPITPQPGLVATTL